MKKLILTFILAISYLVSNAQNDPRTGILIGYEESAAIKTMAKLKTYKFMKREMNPNGYFLMYSMDVGGESTLSILDFNKKQICDKVTKVMPLSFFVDLVQMMSDSKNFIKSETESLTFISTDKSIKATINTSEKYCEIIYTHN